MLQWWNLERSRDSRECFESRSNISNGLRIEKTEIYGRGSGILQRPEDPEDASSLRELRFPSPGARISTKPRIAHGIRIIRRRSRYSRIECERLIQDATIPAIDHGWNTQWYRTYHTRIYIYFAIVTTKTRALSPLPHTHASRPVTSNESSRSASSIWFSAYALSRDALFDSPLASSPLHPLPPRSTCIDNDRSSRGQEEFSFNCSTYEARDKDWGFATGRDADFLVQVGASVTSVAILSFAPTSCIVRDVQSTRASDLERLSSSPVRLIKERLSNYLDTSALKTRRDYG